MSGKGSTRRPAAISAVEAERNWARTFGNADSERCKGAPAQRNVETIPEDKLAPWARQNSQIQFRPLTSEMLRDAAEKLLALNGKRHEAWLSDQPISPTEGA